jgi:hypothetical protein
MKENLFERLRASLASAEAKASRESGPENAEDDEFSQQQLIADDLGAVLDEYRSIQSVARYDGNGGRDRETHRKNFNDYYNPLVLVVSRVGGEGIDLQHQCRHIIHYDLEWNPAVMEQREGRVDRVGWLSRGNGEPAEPAALNLDVHFLLLKGTYDERIFHTVMQRDQWFQVLIGSKKNRLGTTDDPETDTAGFDLEDETTSRLTEGEKQDVMLDLRPRPWRTLT